ncbi:protein-lysine methyltransferase C42C1,13 [Ceratobasidium sp. AG-Ba]|nr:protein-lysine methyltransferase C42C1,13 [Ceratobasidium sp. AG-Ba]
MAYDDYAHEPTKPFVDDIPQVPGGLVILPSGSVKVVDADEEIFLLYSRSFENKDEDGIQGLGSIDSLANTLTLNFTLHPPVLDQPQGPQVTKGRSRHGKARRESKDINQEKVIEIEVSQDITGLRSRKGDTGSVVWRASVHLARLLLQQHFFPPLPPHSALLNPALLASAHIVELGSGTGILGRALPPLLATTGRITLTDLPELVPLLRKNAKSDKVSVEALDWTWPILPSFEADLVLCVDCIYNTALVRPLVRVLSTCRSPVLVFIELRDEDVIRVFLEEWLNWESTSAGGNPNEKFQVWRLADGLLHPRFAAWVGWKAEQSN